MRGFVSGWIGRCLLTLSVGLAFAYDAFGSYFFGNNTVPGLTLTTDQPMKKEQVDELERRIKEGHEGLTNSQRLMILTNGLKPADIDKMDPFDLEHYF